MAQVNAANWSNVPTIKAPAGNYFAQGQQCTSAPAAGATPSIKLAPDTYVSAAQAPKQVQPAAVQASQNDGLFGALASLFKGVETAAVGAAAPIAVAIGGAASAIGSAVNGLLSEIPSNPPLQQAAQQPAPSGPQFAPAYVAQLQAKAATQFDQSGIGQVGAFSGDLLQQMKATFVQQAVSQDEAARVQATQLASDTNAATQAINGLYQQALGRNPRPDELKQALQSLTGGTMPQEIGAGLQQSPEAQLRAAYMQTYGHDFPSDEARNWYMGELAAKGLAGAKQEMAFELATYKQYNLPS